MLSRRLVSTSNITARGFATTTKMAAERLRIGYIPGEHLFGNSVHIKLTQSTRTLLDTAPLRHQTLWSRSRHQAIPYRHWRPHSISQRQQHRRCDRLDRRLRSRPGKDKRKQRDTRIQTSRNIRREPSVLGHQCGKQELHQ
jgi:hypothetical protein